MGLSRASFKISRRFLIVLGSIFLFILVVQLWGFQTVMCLEMRSRARRFPLLNLTPRPLPSLVVDARRGTKLLPNGFAFEVPWSGFDAKRSKLFPYAAVFAFESGHAINFFGSDRIHENLLAEVQKDFGDSQGNLTLLLGPEATRSDYEFQKTILWATPSEVRPWTGRRESVRASFLLLLKAVASVGGETGLFAVQANGWRGFQLDDPAKGPKRVTLELYDPQDFHVEIVFSTARDGRAKLTQADVNRVLETLHRDGHGVGALAQLDPEKGSN